MFKILRLNSFENYLLVACLGGHRECAGGHRGGRGCGIEIRGSEDRLQVDRTGWCCPHSLPNFLNSFTIVWKWIGGFFRCTLLLSSQRWWQLGSGLLDFLLILKHQVFWLVARVASVACFLFFLVPEDNYCLQVDWIAFKLSGLHLKHLEDAAWREGRILSTYRSKHSKSISQSINIKKIFQYNLESKVQGSWNSNFSLIIFASCNKNICPVSAWKINKVN